MAAADWSSLHSDLLLRLGDGLLDDGDIDYYMGMRAVCHGWRSAIPKPRTLGVGADPRFRPRNWVMLHEAQFEEAADGRRLFVNVSTGRFLRRRVPMLDDHHLLVLREKTSRRAIRVLEPFTGSVLHSSNGDEDDRMPTHTVYFVPDPATELRAVQFPQYSEGREPYYVTSMVSHAGRVYVADSEGCMFRIVDTERPSFGYGELIAKMSLHANLHLVESGGELLLVCRQSLGDAAQVYRVDVDRKLLEPLDNIGSRALFLGFGRCLSVDADKFPAIDRNCLYYQRPHSDINLEVLHDSGIELLIWSAIYRYDLSRGGMQEHVSDDKISPSYSLIAPLSLAKVFLDYCNRLAD